MRGGKTNDFEGGVRAAAFLSGGFLPAELRGTTNHAYMHACDWCTPQHIAAPVQIFSLLSDVRAHRRHAVRPRIGGSS